MLQFLKYKHTKKELLLMLRDESEEREPCAMHVLGANPRVLLGAAPYYLAIPLVPTKARRNLG